MLSSRQTLAEVLGAAPAGVNLGFCGICLPLPPLHGGSGRSGGVAPPAPHPLTWIFKTLEPVSSEPCLQLRRQLPPPHTSCRLEAFLVSYRLCSGPLLLDPFGILLFVGCEFSPILGFWIWDLRGVFFLFHLKCNFFLNHFSLLFVSLTLDPVCVCVSLSSCRGQI